MKKNILIFISGMLTTLVLGVGASVLFNARDIEFKSDNFKSTNVDDAINELYDIIKNDDLYLIEQGTIQREFNSYADNSNSYARKINNYIYVWSGGSGLYSNYYTEVDLSNYNYLKMNGTINNSNTASGSLYITKNTNLVMNNQAVKYALLDPNTNYYIIDVSDLSGKYYIGVTGSNRYITLYDLWLSK